MAGYSMKKILFIFLLIYNCRSFAMQQDISQLGILASCAYGQQELPTLSESIGVLCELKERASAAKREKRIKLFRDLHAFWVKKGLGWDKKKNCFKKRRKKS